MAIWRAENDKARTYPELAGSTFVRLVTVACETEGRWSEACIDMLRSLATARSRSAPTVTRHSARAYWHRRWRTLLSVAQQDSLAATLIDDVPSDLDGVDGAAPDEVEVWVAALAR